jgi:glycosyltransferase involved in cell wall biosynthesis
VKIAALLHCYNEAHIIEECLVHYLAQGIDVAIVDNESTDETLAIIDKVRGNLVYPGRVLDVLSIRTRGFELRRILATLCEHMHAHLSHYPWLMLVDADTFFDSPVAGLSLGDFIAVAHDAAYNVIDGILYQFYPTELDDPAVARHAERLQYFEILRPEDTELIVTAERIFRYDPSIDFFSRAGHVCLRASPRRVFFQKYLHRHYRWTSYEHGLQKIFRDRIPRYTERLENPAEHRQYLGLRANEADLIRPAKSLSKFDPQLHLIPAGEFYRRLRICRPTNPLREKGSGG